MLSKRRAVRSLRTPAVSGRANRSHERFPRPDLQTGRISTDFRSYSDHNSVEIRDRPTHSPFRASIRPRHARPNPCSSARAVRLQFCGSQVVGPLEVGCCGALAAHERARLGDEARSSSHLAPIASWSWDARNLVVRGPTIVAIHTANVPRPASSWLPHASRRHAAAISSRGPWRIAAPPPPHGGGRRSTSGATARPPRSLMNDVAQASSVAGG